VVWNEAVKISGADPDFRRRDLWDAILISRASSQADQLEELRVRAASRVTSQPDRSPRDVMLE